MKNAQKNETKIIESKEIEVKKDPPKTIESVPSKPKVKHNDTKPSPKNIKKQEKPKFDILIMDSAPRSPKKDKLNVEIVK